ncbi:MATE family efflux transporter [Phormidium tenue FACHB-886]|nr:MATE family efflux transporter [Phormidium tenue FACHB-886]
MPSTFKPKLTTEIKAMLFLAVPLASAQVAQAATGFVDTVMMGLLGQQVLAAGALGATFFTSLLHVSSSIVAAVSPLVAAAFGAGDSKEVSRVVRQGLWLAILLGVPLTLLIWNGEMILPWLGQAPENVRLAGMYLRAIAPGLLPALGFAVLRSFVAAVSQPRSVMVIIVGGTAFNVVANYTLMFGKLGLPALGIVGIGVASALSLWGMFLAIVLYIFWQQSLRSYQVFGNLQRFDARVFQDLIGIGLPIGGLVAVEAGLFAIATFLMGFLGTVPLAAHQIALQTAAMTFMIPLGISFAATIRVGQLMGQRDPKGARLAGYVAIGLGAAFMGLMSILFWLAPQTIIALYLDVNNPENGAVVDLAKVLLSIAALFQLADGVQATSVGALRGLQDTRVPMLIGLLSYWGIGLSISYGLGFSLGLGGVGLWWGLAIGLLVQAFVLTWRFHQTTSVAQDQLL